MHRPPSHIQIVTQTSLGCARSMAHVQIGLYTQSEPKASESPQSPCAPVWWKQTAHSQTNLHVNKASEASTSLQTCHTGFTDYKEWDSTHRLKHTNVGAHRTTNRHIDALKAFRSGVFCLSSRCCSRTGLLKVCVMSGSSRTMSQIPQDKKALDTLVK